jgi:hypothetical protein
VRRQIRALLGARLVALVFNFLDIMAHGRSESDLLQELAPDETAFRAVVRAWFAHSPLFEIFRRSPSRTRGGRDDRPRRGARQARRARLRQPRDLDATCATSTARTW